LHLFPAGSRGVKISFFRVIVFVSQSLERSRPSFDVSTSSLAVTLFPYTPLVGASTRTSGVPCLRPAFVRDGVDAVTTSPLLAFVVVAVVVVVVGILARPCIVLFVFVVARRIPMRVTNDDPCCEASRIILDDAPRRRARDDDRERTTAVRKSSDRVDGASASAAGHGAGPSRGDGDPAPRPASPRTAQRDD
jgi:hypothetical protein